MTAAAAVTADADLERQPEVFLDVTLVVEQLTQAVRKLGLRFVEIGDAGGRDADTGALVVGHDGGTEQLLVADGREVDVEVDAVVDGQTHQL